MSSCSHQPSEDPWPSCCIQAALLPQQLRALHAISNLTASKIGVAALQETFREHGGLPPLINIIHTGRHEQSEEASVASCRATEALFHLTRNNAHSRSAFLLAFPQCYHHLPPPSCTILTRHCRFLELHKLLEQSLSKSSGQSVTASGEIIVSSHMHVESGLLSLATLQYTHVERYTHQTHACMQAGRC